MQILAAMTFVSYGVLRSKYITQIPITPNPSWYHSLTTAWGAGGV